MAEDFQRRLEVEAQVDGRIVDFVVEAQYAVDTERKRAAVVHMSVVVPGVIVNTQVSAGAYVPFQARGVVDIAMYFIQAGKAKTVIPEIANSFDGPVIANKMFNGNATGPEF